MNGTNPTRDSRTLHSLRRASLLGLALLEPVLCAGLAHAQKPDSQKPDPQKAEQAYLSGARLVEQKDLPAAEAAFARAAALDPAHAEYAQALASTREQHIADLVSRSARARMLTQTADADALLAQARALDPANPMVQQHTEAAATAGPAALAAASPGAPSNLSFAGPIQLQPEAAAKDLHLRGEPRQVIQQAAAQFGIKTVFDDDVSGPPLRLDVEKITYDQAMRVLFSMTHLFGTVLDQKTLLVAKDTQDTRARLERQVQETVYIPGYSKVQIDELTNIVKNIFDVTRIFASTDSGTIVIRAPESTIRSVNYTLADLVDGGADVVLRLQLISVEKSHTRNTGANTPSSVGVFSVAAEAQSIVSQNQAAVQALISSGAYTPSASNSYTTTIIQEALLLVLSGVVTDAKVSNLLTVFGGGLTFFGVNYAGNAAFNLALNASEARALDDISVRIGDQQTTTLRIGSKYPITTSTYSSGLSSSTAALIGNKTINGVSVASLLAQASSVATVPMVQFEDLGITLKAEAGVQKSGLVMVRVDLKLEALTGASANGIPVLTSRAFTSNLSLADGSTAIMLSDLSKTEAASISGIPGLADLPGFQQSAADTLRETDSSELVLLVTPHVVHRRSDALASRRISFTPTVPQDN